MICYKLLYICDQKCTSYIAINSMKPPIRNRPYVDHKRAAPGPGPARRWPGPGPARRVPFESVDQWFLINEVIFQDPIQLTIIKI